MSNGMTNGKVTAQLDLFEDIMKNNTNNDMAISDKTTEETASPMKDSGVEWIGEIPAEWICAKTKYYMQFINGRAYEQHELLDEGRYRVLRVGNFNTNDVWYYSDLELPLKQYCNNGDLLYLWATTFGPAIWQGEQVIFHYHIWKVLLNNTVNKKYIYYVLGAQADWQKTQSHGTTMVHITKKGIEDSYIPVPPLSEQVAIASHLDSITSRIDEAVRLIDEQLADLKDYRKALISEVVTRGVPSDSTPQPTKPTNTKWIPEIPTHWTTQRGKNCLILLNRSVRNDDDVITAFRDGTVTLRTNRRTEGFTFSDKEIGYQGIEPGDLVIHGMDAFAGTLGISDSRGKGSPILIVLDSPHNKDYLRYQLLTMAWYGVFTATATGIRVRSCDLRWNKLANMTFMLPPFAEQEAIVSYLDEMTGRISDMENNLTTQRDELLAYRQSVISEYVTGKKRVG